MKKSKGNLCHMGKKGTLKYFVKVQEGGRGEGGGGGVSNEKKKPYSTSEP